MPPRRRERWTLTAVKSRRSWHERRRLRDFQGAALRGAQNGRGIFDYALATLIWHEMAHLAGASEREAQRQEEELWSAVRGDRPGRHESRAELSGATEEAPSEVIHAGVLPPVLLGPNRRQHSSFIARGGMPPELSRRGACSQRV